MSSLQRQFARAAGRAGVRVIKRKNFDHLQCPVAATLSVIGDHWSILIIRDLFFGLSRFDELHADLGIARNVLSDRLKKLVAEGIVERSPGARGHAEYHLSESGRELRKVMISMAKWGEVHRPEKSGVSKWRELSTQAALRQQTTGQVKNQGRD